MTRRRACVLQSSAQNNTYMNSGLCWCSANTYILYNRIPTTSTIINSANTKSACWFADCPRAPLGISKCFRWKSKWNIEKIRKLVSTVLYCFTMFSLFHCLWYSILPSIVHYSCLTTPLLNIVWKIIYSTKMLLTLFSIEKLVIPYCISSRTVFP